MPGVGDSESQDMTRIHCGSLSHYYNIYIYIVHIYPPHTTDTVAREWRDNESGANGEGERHAEEEWGRRYECNNPPTLFGQPVRECG